MNKKIAFAGLGFLLLAAPGFSHAQTTDAQSQIAALIAQIQAQIQSLEAQIASLSGAATTTSQSSGGSACTYLTHSLYLGLQDSEVNGDVTLLQQFLVSQGTSIYPEQLVTGFFGPATERGVERWQSAHGIVTGGSPDTTGWGVVGPQTRATIGCIGASATPASALQTSPASGASPLAVAFTTGSLPYTSLNDSYTLNFGDGSSTPLTDAGCSKAAGTSCSYQAAHSYAVPGAYQASVTDRLLCVAGSSEQCIVRVSGESALVVASGGADSESIALSESSQSAAQGGTVSFSWNTANATSGSAVVLYLFNPDGTLNGRITEDADASGTFAWTVPGSACDQSRHCAGESDNPMVWQTSPGNYKIVAELYSPKGGLGGGLVAATSSLQTLAVSSPVSFVIASPAPSGVSISSLSPASGSVGTQVTVSGSGFTGDNTVIFGPGEFAQVPSSGNGTSLVFTVPGIVYPGCYSSAGCESPALAIIPGAYPVSVQNANGTSSPATFQVATSSVSCATPTHDLSLGESDAGTGGDVTILQQFLVLQGSSIYPDALITGYFGTATKAAVRRFQAANNIEQTGYVGRITRAAIAAICSGNQPGSSPFSFTATPQGATLPITVAFDASNLENLGSASYVVDFGDGAQGTMSSSTAAGTLEISHAYAKNGTYGAKLYEEQNLCGGADTSYGCVSLLQVSSAQVNIEASSTILGPKKAIFFNSPGLGTWTVPSDWNSSANTIEVIGGGGASGAPGGSGNQDGGAGGGGAYSRISNNLPLTPGASVEYFVGAGGTYPGGSGSSSWFNGSGASSASVMAEGGKGGASWSAGCGGYRSYDIYRGVYYSDYASGTGCQGGQGGQASVGIGSLKYSGGNGAQGGYAIDAGGGGAAGWDGNGADGILTQETAGVYASTGGTGGTGDNGQGGVGGAKFQAGGNGGEWQGAYGSGGGGGAAGSGGGLYGGGSGNGNGNGAPGLIVITYAPFVSQ